MWVKICGTTSLEDAHLAIDAGANALGFIFAPSPRHVSAAQVKAITAHLPAAIETYGVFVDASFEEIVSTVQEAGLTGVQLHSSADPDLPRRLREQFPGSLGTLQVLHFTTPQELDSELQALRHSQAVDAVLVDSRTGTAGGGTGIPFDWSAARASFGQAALHLRLIAAGGLSPENVAAAIHALQPWGVDVVTGVEAEPGRKDPARVRAFVQAAHQALTPGSLSR